ncbi:SPFH domain-containing protein [Paenarthrobacter sp. PH39-S1]|uniref:slipin family protein n=1 Tax=Paenarthrobacter sp. PH39-S1 TaxID=3046204 RepID=UPI0032D8BF59
MTWWQVLILVVVVVVLVVLAASVKVLREYERGVAFRLGRLRPVLDPGVHLIFPGLEKMVRVDLRIVTLTIPPQEVITKDNVPARVNAVVLFQVTDPIRSVMGVENHAVATSQMAQTTLRSVVGRADLDTLLAHRTDLNEDLARTIDAQTEPWGVHVRVVEIKDVEIPEAMQRAMAREAEAERERRAKIINARGELQAADELRQAADILSGNPASLQLRYLQTLLELGADQNSTVVFPLPMDIIGPFLDKVPRWMDKLQQPEPPTPNHNGSKRPQPSAGPSAPPLPAMQEQAPSLNSHSEPHTERHDSV